MYYLCCIQSHGGVGDECVKDMATDFNEGVKTQRERSFNEKENRSRRVFEWAVRQYGGVWHLCTPGERQTVIFKSDEDYVFGMILVAMCAYDCPDIQIITFELMSNHVHFVLCGSKERVLAFFALFKKRLIRYYVSVRKKVNLDHFDCKEPITIDNLESLRNQIGYTNRNNFVVDPDHTPFSYPYGANSFYFMPVNKLRKDGCFGDLTERAKRVFLHTKQVDYPGRYVIIDGYFSPINYCRLDIGEGVFRDARHYFNKLSKNIESFKDVAAALGDSIYYTDDELSDVLYYLSKEKYGGHRIASLGKEDKMNVARMLHYDYNADNAKIARLIHLDKPIVDAMFPSRK